MDSLRAFFLQHFSPGDYQPLDGYNHAASGEGQNNPYNEPAALAACRTGDLHWLGEEIEKDRALVFRHYWSGRTGNMIPLLLVVAQEGHLEVAKLLIRHGAGVNQVSDKGLAPLYSAARRGHLEMAELLIHHGAKVNQPTFKGLTPLSSAAWGGYLEVVELFICHGAEVNQASDKGSTPISLAAEQGHPEVVELLIRHGAEVNRASDNGWTPLLFAAEKGHSEVVELLIRHGAEVNRALDDGTTPLYFAAQNGYTEIVKCLLKAGADPQKKWAILKIWKLAAITKSPLTAAQMNAKNYEIADMIEKAIRERKVHSVNHQGKTAVGGLSS